jgi:hypothetical protein
LSVGDEHLPTVLLKRVVHEARAVHRLDHRAHAVTMRAPHDAVQPIDVGRNRQLPSRLAALVKQADVQSPSA